MSGSDFHVRVFESPGEMAGLAGDWDALAARVPGYSLSQTFAWVWQGWQTQLANAGAGRLKLVSVWSGTKLVGIWTFCVRSGLFYSVARPLGSGGDEDTGGPLMEDAGDIDKIAALIWSAVIKFADVVIVFNIPVGSAAERYLARSIKHRIPDYIPALSVSPDGHSDWSSYYESLSPRLRTGQRQDLKRLQKKGRVTFECACGKEERDAAIDWILARKREWLVRTGRHSTWIQTRQCREFWVAAAASENALGRVCLFALKLDGNLIAACISAVDSSRAEFYITTFDDDLAHYSPGKLLIEHHIKWAFDRKLEFDFRIVADPYKTRWANRNRLLTTQIIAANTWSLSYLFLFRLKVRIGSLRRMAANMIKPEHRKRIKRLFRFGRH